MLAELIRMMENSRENRKEFYFTNLAADICLPKMIAGLLSHPKRQFYPSEIIGIHFSYITNIPGDTLLSENASRSTLHDPPPNRYLPKLPFGAYPCLHLNRVISNLVYNLNSPHSNPFPLPLFLPSFTIGYLEFPAISNRLGYTVLKAWGGENRGPRLPFSFLRQLQISRYRKIPKATPTKFHTGRLRAPRSKALLYYIPFSMEQVPHSYTFHRKWHPFSCLSYRLQSDFY